MCANWPCKEFMSDCSRQLIVRCPHARQQAQGQRTERPLESDGTTVALYHTAILRST